MSDQPATAAGSSSSGDHHEGYDGAYEGRAPLSAATTPPTLTEWAAAFAKHGVIVQAEGHVYVRCLSCRAQVRHSRENAAHYCPMCGTPLPKEGVSCYAENPHEAHDWTFSDDYPLMRCPGQEGTTS